MTPEILKLQKILRLAQRLQKQLNIDFKEAYILAKERIDA
jgi:hypothetical protein